MAATRIPGDGAAPAGASNDELEQTVTALARVMARMAVRSAPAQGAASFASIVVNELRIATHEEAVQIERWLTGHP